MNKKFLSAILFGALMVSSTGTFVSCKDYDGDIDELWDAVNKNATAATDALNEKVTALTTQISTLSAAKDQLAKDLESAKADAAEKVAEAKKAASDAQGTADKALADADNALARVATLEAQIKGAESAITSLKATDAELQAELKTVNELIAANDAKVTKNFMALDAKVDDAKAELVASIKNVASALDAEISRINALESADKQLAEDIEALSGKLASQLSSLETAYKAADAAILGKVDANATEISELKEKALTLEEGLRIQKDALETYKTLVATELDKKADQTALDDAQSQIDAMLDEATGLKAQWTAAVNDALEQAANDATTKVADLKSEITEELGSYVTTAKLNEIFGADGKKFLQLGEQVNDISNSLDVLTALLSNRLTSLLFAPAAYIGGIEAIPFTTFLYTPWTNLKGDAADGTKTISINNGTTTAEYYVSPSGVAKKDIKEVTALMGVASNMARSTGSELIGVEVSDITNGKMTINLTKNVEGTFASELNDQSKFYIMALQATLSDDALTAAEKEAGKTVVVTSDWARVYEETITPNIHKTQEVAEETELHFNHYAIIHTGAADNDVNNTKGLYIAKKVAYNTPGLDLHTLVTLCGTSDDKATAEDRTYNAADYGMKYEFALVPYYLQDNAEQPTNQQNFAVIDENGVITSRAHDNTTVNNGDAIGREPMIQVKLIDTKRDNNVVDVAYFKIQWTAVSANVSVDNFNGFEQDFACGGVLENIVGTPDMNEKLYTVMNMSKDVFHVNYKLDANLYASKEDAAAGKDGSESKWGTIEEITTGTGNTTYNLKWTYTEGGIDAYTAEQYNAGKVVRTVYGRYMNIANPLQTVTFKLTMDEAIAKMSLHAGYNGTQWNTTDLTTSNTTKALQVNPALTSDAVYGAAIFKDCQIITDILKGYNIAGETVTLANLISADEDTKAEFVFDENRLTEVFGAAHDYTVSVDGTQLLKGGVIAATIEGSIIRLYENPAPTTGDHGVPTTAAQTLLGKNVPVMLVSENCAGIVRTIDKFLVNFINPLKMKVSQEDTNLYDLISGGSSINIEKAVTITETFGLFRDVRWIDEAGEVETNDVLIGWYNVGAITWDIAKAKTNLYLDGNTIKIGTAFNTNWSDFAAKYKLAVSVDGETITFENNSGDHTQQKFAVKVPVSVATKWNPALADPETTMVTLTINPGEVE